MKKAKEANVTVLLSGGIDSSACLHFYLHQGSTPRPLFVDYGQPAARAEAESALAICTFYKVRLKTVKIKGPKIPKSGEIMGRNLALISCALLDTGTDSNLIALGIHTGTNYFDCGEDFIKVCGTLLDGYSDGRARLAVPFLALNKAEIWRYCKENAVPLNLTWSCETNNKKACGMCLSCKDKETLLASA